MSLGFRMRGWKARGRTEGKVGRLESWATVEIEDHWESLEISGGPPEAGIWNLSVCTPNGSSLELDLHHGLDAIMRLSLPCLLNRNEESSNRVTVREKGE